MVLITVLAQDMIDLKEQVSKLTELNDDLERRLIIRNQETESKIAEVVLSSNERVHELQQQLLDQLKSQLDRDEKGKDHEKKRAAKLMKSTMQRMLSVQLSVGWVSWLNNVGMAPEKNKAAALMVRTMKRMLQVQLSQGWLKWRAVFNHEQLLRNRHAVGLALEERDKAMFQAHQLTETKAESDKQIAELLELNDFLMSENGRLSMVVGELQEARLASAQQVASISEAAESRERQWLAEKLQEASSGKDKGTRLMVRTMKRMLCAQLGVGFKAWLINTNTGKHKDKGAMTMIKTMKRMLAAQVGAGWSKWFQFILDQRREEEERTLEGALEGRRTAEQHARQMKEQWDRIKVSLETDVTHWMGEANRQAEIITKLEARADESQWQASSSVFTASVAEGELKLLQKANQAVVDSLQSEVKALTAEKMEATEVHAQALRDAKQSSLKECVTLRKALAAEREGRERDKAELTTMAITMRENRQMAAELDGGLDLSTLGSNMDDIGSKPSRDLSANTDIRRPQSHTGRSRPGSPASAVPLATSSPGPLGMPRDTPRESPREQPRATSVSPGPRGGGGRRHLGRDLSANTEIRSPQAHTGRSLPGSPASAVPLTTSSPGLYIGNKPYRDLSANTDTRSPQAHTGRFRPGSPASTVPLATSGPGRRARPGSPASPGLVGVPRDTPRESPREQPRATSVEPWTRGGGGRNHLGMHLVSGSLVPVGSLGGEGGDGGVGGVGGIGGVGGVGGDGGGGRSREHTATTISHGSNGSNGSNGYGSQDRDHRNDGAGPLKNDERYRSWDETEDRGARSRGNFRAFMADEPREKTTSSPRPSSAMSALSATARSAHG